MSDFTDEEIAYLRSQRLGRLATVDDAGEPHVVPVGFRYNAESDTIDIAGVGMGTSKKFRDAGKHPMVAFVVDDIKPPSQPRGIEVRGRAEALPTGGKAIVAAADEQFIRIYPMRIATWGIVTTGRRLTGRSTNRRG